MFQAEFSSEKMNLNKSKEMSLCELLFFLDEPCSCDVYNEVCIMELVNEINV